MPKKRLFLAWKSRAVCDGLITLNRGGACGKTACLCPCPQENRNVLAPNSKIIVDSNNMHFLLGKLFVNQVVFRN